MNPKKPNRSKKYLRQFRPFFWRLGPLEENESHQKTAVVSRICPRKKTQLKQKINPSLKNCKTTETFFVFKVSVVTFATDYEGDDYTKSN